MDALLKGRMRSTQESEYTEHLIQRESIWWKKLLDVQRPYRWNIRRLGLGFTIDVGCGIGRHLLSLKGNGVGIDHNKTSVEIARKRGLRAFTPDEFRESPFNKPETFDSLLLSHVAEHMHENQAIELLKAHLALVKHSGTVVVITPQEAGFKSDPTHVDFMDFEKVRRVMESSGVRMQRQYSFPFPRFVGTVFRHNEFVSIGVKH
jgi:SAM-dependent methyltransferase